MQFSLPLSKLYLQMPRKCSFFPKGKDWARKGTQWNCHQEEGNALELLYCGLCNK